MKASSRIVIHLRPSNFYGGPEKQIVEHAVLLPDLGWHAIAASFQEGRDSVEFLQCAAARGLETATIDCSGPFDIRAIAKLRELLTSSGASLLVAHGYKADVVGFHAGRATGVPVIACVRGFTGESAKIRLFEAIDRLYLKRMRLVIAVSEGGAQMLFSLGIHPERVRVVPNAVHVPADHIAPNELRNQYSIPEGAPLLVAAGRLSPEKGHDVLVRAVALLGSMGVDAHLVLLGVGPQQAALAKLARDLGVLERVHLAGFRRDVLACFAAADLVVNPSHTEGLPNVVLEAMSVGAPVLATAVGGVPEILEHGVTGWLVPPGSPERMAEQIKNTLMTPDYRPVVGSAARHSVTDRFTFQRQAQTWLGAYESCVGAAAAAADQECRP